MINSSILTPDIYIPSFERITNFLQGIFNAIMHIIDTVNYLVELMQSWLSHLTDLINMISGTFGSLSNGYATTGYWYVISILSSITLILVIKFVQRLL